MLQKIMEGPSLLELLQLSIEKSDREAAWAAEERLTLMRKHAERNLAGRVNLMLGLPNQKPPIIDIDDAGTETAQTGTHHHLSIDSPGLTNPSPKLGATPSRRAKDELSKIVSEKMEKAKYVPYTGP